MTVNIFLNLLSSVVFFLHQCAVRANFSQRAGELEVVVSCSFHRWGQKPGLDPSTAPDIQGSEPGTSCRFQSQEMVLEIHQVTRLKHVSKGSIQRAVTAMCGQDPSRRQRQD